MKEQGNMAQEKKQNKSPETYSKETKVDGLPHKELKIKILFALKKTMHEQNKNVNKEIDKNKQNKNKDKPKLKF